MGTPGRSGSRGRIVRLAGPAAALAVAAGGALATAPAGRYTVTAGTVLDNATGLLWQRTPDSGSYDFTGAATYCHGLDLGGFASGWRVPSKLELETLVDGSAVRPAIDSAAFPNTPGIDFWTSTPYAYSSGNAWTVTFSDGASGYWGTSMTNAVRCVR